MRRLACRGLDLRDGDCILPPNPLIIQMFVDALRVLLHD
jgi:hypothetical protein